MPNIFQPQENQSSSAAVFNNGNPFLNFGITFGTPVTQVPFRLPFYTPAPNTSAPETSPISHGSFPNKIGPPTPEPSLLDLIPIKVGPAQTKSELSKWNTIESVSKLHTLKLKEYLQIHRSKNPLGHMNIQEFNG